jgi:hypothetical protein
MNAEHPPTGKAYRNQHSGPYVGEEQRSQAVEGQVHGLLIAARGTSHLDLAESGNQLTNGSLILAIL